MVEKNGIMNQSSMNLVTKQSLVLMFYHYGINMIDLIQIMKALTEEIP
jgi:hypothetical protein